jgi:(2R)-ethylmalonyl-CoA mutase
VIEARTQELRDEAQAELDDVLFLGGAFEAVDELKGRLVRSMADRTRRIETGEQVVVGVNRFTESEPSPLVGEGSILRVDPAVEAEAIADVHAWRNTRDGRAVLAALDELRVAAHNGTNIMGATIALAHAGGTTGEWGETLREVFGEFRAPTGIAAAGSHRSPALAVVAQRSSTLAGGPPRLLVAKPGLDGHSNGAEQIAVAARDAGMEVIYSGIRLTTDQIVASARDEDPDVIGLSILSGSHLSLVPELVRDLRAAGVEAPVIVGGIIPDDDRPELLGDGVAAVYTPKDFELARIMGDIVDLTERARVERFAGARVKGVPSSSARGSAPPPSSSSNR